MHDFSNLYYFLSGKFLIFIIIIFYICNINNLIIFVYWGSSATLLQTFMYATILTTTNVQLIDFSKKNKNIMIYVYIQIGSQKLKKYSVEHGLAFQASTGFYNKV